MSLSERIVYTRPDGCVSVVTPDHNMMAYWNAGGFFGESVARGTVEIQIERKIASGVAPDVASKHINALVSGGLSTQECFAMVRDLAMFATVAEPDPVPLVSFCTGIELWPSCDMQGDRWFRDAWRRDAAGGPIAIDMDAAREVQAAHILAAIESFNETARRENEIALLTRPLTNGPAIAVLDTYKLRPQIMAAKTPDELRTVWPQELTRPRGH